MAVTIAQLASFALTAGQQTKLQQAKAIGDALILYQQQRNQGAQLPDLNASGLTLAQAKAVDNWVRDLNTLLHVIQLGAQYFRTQTIAAAQASADATAPAAF
jgi:hypothetical protein